MNFTNASPPSTSSVAAGEDANELADHPLQDNDDGGTNNGSSHIIRDLPEEKRVKQLRLAKALTVHETTIIHAARSQMAAQRVDVIVVTDSNAVLIGILTNKDIVKRVNDLEIDTLSTPVSRVMTKNPIFVRSDTLVVEALQKLVQGQVRQLPVIENDKVIGLVDIPLCLSIEMESKEKTAETYEEVIEAAVLRVAQRGLTVKQLPRKGAILIPETTTIYQACCWMAAKKVDVALLTNSYASISGIWKKKDFVLRVITCWLDFLSTPVSKLMTKKPLFMSCDDLSKETLQDIGQGEVIQLLVRENNGSVYLPLCLRTGVLPTRGETDEGRPKQTNFPLPGNSAWDGPDGPGITSFLHVNNSPYPDVDPYELVPLPPQHSSVRPQEQSSNPLPDVNGSDAPPPPGLTPFMHIANSPYPNNLSDELVAPPPQHTDVRPLSKPRRRLKHPSEKLAAPPPQLEVVGPQSSKGLPGVNGNKSSTNIQVLTGERTVKQLLLSEALILPETTSIYETCRQMAAQRADVFVFTDSNSLLTGILTNKDILKGVIYGETDSFQTPVSKVMTKNPIYVMSDTLVEEALQELVQAKVRQLPVIENDKVIGFFEVASAENYDMLIERGAARRGVTLKQLPLEHALTVPETATIYEACCRMAAGKVNVIVLTDSFGLFRGTLTKKDILSRVIPSGIDFLRAPVSMVMTKNNQFFVSSHTLSVEPLQEIAQGPFINFLVIENNEDYGLVHMPLVLSDYPPYTLDSKQTYRY